jgi:putative phosphoribosyl transferase
VVFANRAEAGRQLAACALLAELPAGEVVVLGLPRGGVPVALPIAVAIGAPLDVIVVRKLGVPFTPELGMGAIGEAGARVISSDVISHARVTERQLARVEARERAELDRRARRFRGNRPPLPLDGKIAVIVDDGIATGSTARAACQIARERGAAWVVLAIPVAPPGWQERIGADADAFACLQTPEPFYSIGQFYTDFRPTSDDQVIACLDEAGRLTGQPRTTD